MRVVICEDHALLREGLVALLRENDVEVVGVAEDAERMLRLVERVEPDVLICDVRLPPGFRDEGIRAAIMARQRHTGLASMMRTQYVEPAYTAELLATGEGGVGYLLKERVGDVAAFLESLERVASGGTALDREVIATVMQQRRASDSILARLSDREREVLALMAEGRTNAAIARELVVTVGAVEKHITGMFGKLGLAATDDDHRRVLAVLTFLRESGAA